jgi:hypothetical protein
MTTRAMSACLDRSLAMKLPFRRFIPPAASLLLTCATAGAAVTIDNIAVGTQSSSQSLSGPLATSGFFGAPFPDRQVAFSFTTGNSQYYLHSLEFAMAIGGGSLSPIVATLSTGFAVPGGINPITLGSVAPASSSPTSQILTIAPTIAPLLEANTLYWIHYTVPTGNALYSIANSNAPNVDPEWTLGNSWSRTPTTPWSELDSGPVPRIRMTVTSVPEPGCALLGSLGVFLLLRRKR